jgi:hypothetical protein
MRLQQNGRPLCVVSLILGATVCALASCLSSGSPGETSDGTDSSLPDAMGQNQDGSFGDASSSGDGSSHDATTNGAVTDSSAEASNDALSDGDACQFGEAGEAIELECAGFYSDWASKTVSSDNIEFVPGLQLWSDGADKTRWVHLPTGPDGETQRIDTSNMDEWNFPVGTRFWKEFKLPVGPSTTPIRIETRLLWKKGVEDGGVGNWYRTTYRWSADGETSATELTTGQLNANGNGYEIPNLLMCNTCHSGREDNVLGFEAIALSAPSASLVTMGTLVDAGLLTDPPNGAIVIPGNAVESAALGFLHVNCGTACHNPDYGEANGGTSLLMRLNVAQLSSVQTTDTWTTGWNKLETNFQIPDAAATYRIEACKPGQSAAYYQASVRDDPDAGVIGAQMPPIDTHAVDPAGLAEFAAWINEGCDAGDAGGKDADRD